VRKMASRYISHHCWAVKASQRLYRGTITIALNTTELDVSCCKICAGTPWASFQAVELFV
jgi:hypothetical protein